MSYLCSHPAAALATVLFQQLHVRNHHAAVGGLAHVIDGQQRHLHGGQGFHFHPGLADGFGGGRADDGRVFWQDFED